jgi:hypothetical protein
MPSPLSFAGRLRPLPYAVMSGVFFSHHVLVLLLLAMHGHAPAVRTELSEEPVALPLRLGVAYPMRGEVMGEGVGAILLGEFSTGTVVERVTEWIPNQKLACIMLDDVPAMRELSP